MPPVDFGGTLSDGSASSHGSCSIEHELEDCFKWHTACCPHLHLFVVAIATTALVLCCCLTWLVRRCCCAATDHPTMRELLSPMERQSFRQGLMRRSEWNASTSERQPLLSPRSPASISESTKLLAESPLVNTPLQQPAASATLRSLWETVSGVRKGANELINNDNYAEVGRACLSVCVCLCLSVCLSVCVCVCLSLSLSL
eukprot:COSAG03_NODE_4648_length_1479_cov_3.896377_1_plen_200_part_10